MTRPSLSLAKAKRTATTTIGVVLIVSSSAQALVGGNWVNMPSDGVVTGMSGGRGPLAVCRSPFDNGQQPGKLWEGQCNFGWGGDEKRSSVFQVLRDNGYQWANPGKFVDMVGIRSFEVNLPINAVDGGNAGSAAGGARLGVCQAFDNRDQTWHPGKFYAKKCNIAWGGKEIARDPDAAGNVLVLVK